MTHAGTLAAIAGVFLLACLSPGPVWLVITGTSVTVSRKAGVLTGLGVAAATLTWATIAMCGAGILAQLTWATIAIRLAGAAYLASIGVRMIRGARRPLPTHDPAAAHHAGWPAFRRGYVASITNPKAAVFFGSIFVVMLPTQAPAWVDVTTVLLLATVSAAWHCGLALVFSITPIQSAYRRAKRRIDTAIGTVLIVLGLKLAVSR